MRQGRIQSHIADEEFAAREPAKARSDRQRPVAATAGMRWMRELPALIGRAGHRQQGRLFRLENLVSRSRISNESTIRRLCANAYLGDGHAVARVLGRYKMLVDTHDIDLSLHLLLDGFWEMWVTELLPQMIRPGMVCVDVGAHVGYFTMIMADLAGPTGEIHAFEPNPRLRGMLDHSARLNGFADRVRSHGDPVFDVAGLPARLIVPEMQPSAAHLHVASSDEEGESTPLRTCRLDQIAELDRVDFIKIDAESSEEAIWRGMRGLLNRAGPMTVLLEFAAVRYRDAGQFLAAMTGEGFRIHRADPAKGLCPSNAAEILAAPSAREQMLVLIR